MRMTKHMSLNIAGALKNRKHITYMEDETGRFLTNKEAREYLRQCLKEGKRLIPCGDCEGFDYQTGCPGHPLPDEKEIK